MKSLFKLIFLIIIIAIGFFGYNYWNNTYNGQTAFATVPPAQKIKATTSDGKNYLQNGQQVYYYAYNFKWVNADGSTRIVQWNGPESVTPSVLPPGAIVKAKVSSSRVTEGPTIIQATEVPQEIKAKLR